MSRASAGKTTAAAPVSAGATRTASPLTGGVFTLEGNGRRTVVKRPGTAVDVGLKRYVAEASLVMQIDLTASYLNVVIDTTLSRAAVLEYRVEHDPDNWPGEYLTSGKSAHVITSQLNIAALAAGTGRVLEARLTSDGEFDTGWFPTGLVFDTPGKNDPPIVEQWIREQSQE